MHWISPPVNVKELATGDTLGVRSVEGCIEQMRTWPRVGPKTKKAFPICYSALVGGIKPDEARNAFIVAATEAGVLRDQTPRR
ncbi:DUF982 domain-containing protein (plasmid) [Mesorhizobium sp. AR07]|uniref:DUF982 domain-containing protein n=1 Tax=Mesorhizobium sp. AR07 TaxID=2865838 RepID=UPI0021FB6B7C|nr:DUF982 domain-containing protein [Mesorhizobium sp. AR07]